VKGRVNAAVGSLNETKPIAVIYAVLVCGVTQMGAKSLDKVDRCVKRRNRSPICIVMEIKGV
jgi:hypothetical protein